MNEPRVYKTSPVLLVVILLMFVFAIGGVVYALETSSAIFVAPFAALGLLLFAGLAAMQISKVTISNDEISAQNLLGAKTLRWTEIARVSGSGYRIKLHNYDDDVRLSPSPHLPRYEEIVEFIGLKRPDLFTAQEYGEMKRGFGAFAGALVFGIIFAGVMAGFLVSADFSIDSIVPLAIFGFLLLALAGSALASPQALALEGGALRLKYLLNEKVLSADEIGAVQFLYTQTRNGKHYFIALYLTSRKTIRIPSLTVGLPVGYLVLKNWHRDQTQGRFANRPESPSNDIAPNWSGKPGS